MGKSRAASRGIGDVEEEDRDTHMWMGYAVLCPPDHLTLENENSRKSGSAEFSCQ